MKTIFKKSHLPFLKGVVHNKGGRDFWTLAVDMKNQNGLQDQLSAEILLLQHGVMLGDPWSMCELARTYFHHCGDIFLPMALSLWNKAILRNDEGAKADFENLPIYDRIMHYSSADGDRYKEIEMKCALLSEWHLTKLGSSPWETINVAVKKERIKALVKGVCRVLLIPDTEVFFTPGLTIGDSIVDGAAHWEGKIGIREEVLEDYERIIEIVFHELGHIVSFEIMKGSDLHKQVFGITEERIASWLRKDMGYEVVTSEEDPDSLSYGVYTLWATFFCLR